jgi:hypothetical protein
MERELPETCGQLTLQPVQSILANFRVAISFVGTPLKRLGATRMARERPAALNARHASECVRRTLDTQ